MMAIIVYTGNKFHVIWGEGKSLNVHGLHVGVNHIDRAPVGSFSSFKLSIEECDERRRFSVSTSSCICVLFCLL